MNESDAPRPASPALDGALAMLALCLLAGALLACGFDARDAQRAVAGWLLGQPLLAFARNLHHWSAQGLLVVALLVLWRRLRGTAAACAAQSTRAPWALLALAAVLVAMLSGFVLRGDDDAREVQRLLGNALAAVPFMPAAMQTPSSPGAAATLTYALHLGAAGVVAAIVAWTWAGRRGARPRPLRMLAWVAPVILLALFVSPGLHDGIDATLRGPWFLLPLQPLLQQRPLMVAVALVVAVLALWAIPALRAPWRAHAARAAALAGAGYLVLCAGALFVADVTDDGGPARLQWPDKRSDLQWGWVLRSAPPQAEHLASSVVRGRPEGCRACHADTVGFDRSHRPETIGCAACHGGDPYTLDAQRAHRAIVRVPGNLADARRSCGQGACHAATAVRVENSIMSTMAGVITADRRVLGEPVDDKAAPPHANQLGHSAADSHLRELCVSCHLGQPKTEWGAIGQESRGGGCNACHLVYEPQAAAELARYLASEPRERKAAPRTHPGLTVNPSNEHCFGCHSRSSRISTNYEGWHEMNRKPPEGADPSRLRTLDDGRVFERQLPDVHHERGLECIDCHVSAEVMGSGAQVARKSEQLRIACSDCHAERLASRDAQSLDAESRTLLALRGWTLAPQQRLGATRSGELLTNVFVDAQGRGELRRKRDGRALKLAPPRPQCSQRAHARLACTTCHSAWASRCTSCHTEFDPADEGFDHVAQAWVRGTWNESSAPFEVAPPTLGVVERRDANGPDASRIDTFVPGMIMSFDRNREAGKPSDTIFRRLYGLTFAHTIRREVRSCRSCHSDPVALGYGSGTLRYEVARGAGRWRFEPARPPSPQDGLPADAWTGFLQPRTGMVSAQPDMRPLAVDEQKRVLRVGACLTCHAEASTVMRRALADFDATLAQRSRRCVLPEE